MVSFPQVFVSTCLCVHLFSYRSLSLLVLSFTLCLRTVSFSVLSLVRFVFFVFSLLSVRRHCTSRAPDLTFLFLHSFPLSFPCVRPLLEFFFLFSFGSCQRVVFVFSSSCRTFFSQALFSLFCPFLPASQLFSMPAALASAPSCSSSRLDPVLPFSSSSLCTTSFLASFGSFSDAASFFFSSTPNKQKTSPIPSLISFPSLSF